MLTKLDAGSVVSKAVKRILVTDCAAADQAQQRRRRSKRSIILLLGMTALS
jgi:hypothetical protein